MAPASGGRGRARLAQLQFGRALGPDGDRQRPRAEAGERPRAEIGAQRPKLVALGIAPEQISRRSLPAATSLAVERVERDQRHEHLLSAELELLDVLARRDQRGADADVL